MERILLVLGLCVLSFAYGVAAVQYEVFPYRLLREAKLGLEAWAAIDRSNSRFPMAFERFEEGAAPRPQARRLGEGAGGEYVLVSGGPYQMMQRCPRHGCMAWISDRAGRVVHAWEVDLDELWRGLEGVSGDVNRLSLYPVGMALGADGSLVVTFHGRETWPVHIGIAKFDRHGRIVWKRFDRSHHWVATDARAQIYTPYSTSRRKLGHFGSSAVDVPCESGETVLDAIRVLSPEGRMVREVPIVEAFLEAGLRGWFYGVRDGCNPVHLNSVAVATPQVARALPGVEAGDLLVSLRETSTVAVLDGESGAPKYVLAGRTAAQHSARFLPDGTVLAFDNLGGERARGGSRVVRMDLVKRTVATVFPRPGEGLAAAVGSQTAGHIDVSPDGERALVSITHQGRIVEIDVASGRPMWTYDNTHDIAAFLEASGLEGGTTRARFATYGAYYVMRPDFLKEKR